jgi:ribosomal protein S18 acetylase RimI-like enzyme
MPFLSTNHCNPTPHQKPIIRPAQTSDTSELAEIIVASFYDYSGILSWLYPLLQFTVGEDLRYRLRFNSSLYQCLVAIIIDEKAQSLRAGTVEISLKTSLWSAEAQYPYISNLAVKNAYRRQGIAKELLAKCEQIARSWGYDTIQLHVLSHNNMALELYLNSGYQITKREMHWEGFFKFNASRLLLSKKILQN